MKGHRDELAGLGILELGATLRHAHGLEPTKHVGTTFIGNDVSDLHAAGED
jgi:hypothetical protein